MLLPNVGSVVVFFIGTWDLGSRITLFKSQLEPIKSLERSKEKVPTLLVKKFILFFLVLFWSMLNFPSID